MNHKISNFFFYFTSSNSVKDLKGDNSVKDLKGDNSVKDVKRDNIFCKRGTSSERRI
jgi:hypothetical protein